MISSYKNKKILITGGLGFIGSNLAIALSKLGAEIEIYDSLIPGMGGNRFNIKPVKKDIRVTIADLRDGKKIEEAVRGKEVILNLAGTLSHVDSMENPFLDLDINCRGQLCLLEACKKFNRDVKIVYAGTRNQYGKAHYLPVDENHPLEPTDINGVDAIAGEKYHLMYQKVYGIRVVSLRMTNTFGPRHQMRHPKQGVLNWFIRQIMERKTITLMGGGKQIRDVNYIDDVVGACILVGNSKEADGQIYNLGGIPISLADFTKKAIKIWGSGKVKNIEFPRDRKSIEVGNYVADITKIKTKLGWEPTVNIDEGIKRTIDYYRMNKQHYF